MHISSKTAIVTGASSGLGAAIAKSLIDHGAVVYGIGRNDIKLKNLLKKLGDKFIPINLDISNFETVKKWVDKTFSKNPGPDILINNAGVGSFSPIDKMTDSSWNKMVNVNLNGLFYITSEVTKIMKYKTSSTHIINIGSILGAVGRADGTAYCATKFGVQGFSDALFKELRPFNIKVTCINPGSIETSFFKSSGIEAHSNMLQPKDLAETVLHVLKTPDNLLINEMTIRPLHPKPN
ncbi:SDR family oxidoreductase [Xanthomarina sp. F1114]|uniref:SDR family oxidoreductase n=1 Tax=Xanthomarina sp. F1114 TaxID=2996019 RepID=UPI00225DE2A1|nr:SDR family oxidoreductase [Xanthomarina sp. F1114]MCX7547304.1 SDR family oxidoreductase [Xanthomarina sp. F1114]